MHHEIEPVLTVFLNLLKSVPQPVKNMLNHPYMNGYPVVLAEYYMHLTEPHFNFVETLCFLHLLEYFLPEVLENPLVM